MGTFVAIVFGASLLWATVRCIRLWRRKERGNRNNSHYNSSDYDYDSPVTGGIFDSLFGGSHHGHDDHTHHGDTDFDCDGGDD